MAKVKRTDGEIEILGHGDKYIYVVVRKLKKSEVVEWDINPGRKIKATDRDWGFVALEDTPAKAIRTMRKCVEGYTMTGDFGEVFGVASIVEGKCFLLDTMKVEKPKMKESGKKNG